MNFELSYLLTPAIGAAIGYSTNWLAIKMLFRPRTAKYIFGLHIPFTPGIIPKEKGRIAESVGRSISENLMNRDVLERYLLSDDMVGKVRDSANQFIENQKQNEETIRQFLGHLLSDEEINTIAANIQNNLKKEASEKLQNAQIGEKVADVAMTHIANKLNSDDAKSLIPKGLLGGIGSLLGGNIAKRLLESVSDPIKNFLGKQIDGMVSEHGDSIVTNIIGQEAESFLDKRVCDLLKGNEEQLAQLATTAENIYRTTIKEHLPNILNSVDISKIVRDRINELDIMETERIILQEVDKELKYVVWIGAGLGLAMGCLNLIF